MTYKLSGFSLIELIIVLTIIGILSSVALPSYQTYTKKARFVEVISIAETYKTAVAVAIQQGIDLSDISNGKSGIPMPPNATKNLEKLTVSNGIITASGTQSVNKATYILTPSDDGSHFNIEGSCLAMGLCDA